MGFSSEIIAQSREWAIGVSEVAPLLCTIERVQSVYRMPYGSGRKYYTLSPMPIVCHGLTTFLEMIPNKPGEDKGLKEWMKAKGVMADYEFSWSADYGTFMHYLVAEFNSVGYLNLPDVYIQLLAYMKECGIPLVKYKEYCERVSNDIKAWQQFCFDKKVKVLAVEYCVLDADLMIATPLDIICELDFNRKRVICNINLKFRAGEKVQPKDAKQTCIETIMFNRKDLSVKIDMSAIWMPTSWTKTTPTYTFENTTGKYTEKEFVRDWKYVNEMGWMEMPMDKAFPQKLGGELRLGEEPIVSVESLTDFLMKQVQK